MLQTHQHSMPSSYGKTQMTILPSFTSLLGKFILHDMAQSPQVPVNSPMQHLKGILRLLSFTACFYCLGHALATTL